MSDEQTQVETDWNTWNDAELLSRLLRRGVEGSTAKALVRDRALNEAVEEIEQILGQVYYDADGETEARLEVPIDRRSRR